MYVAAIPSPTPVPRGTEQQPRRSALSCVDFSESSKFPVAADAVAVADLIAFAAAAAAITVAAVRRGRESLLYTGYGLRGYLNTQ